MSRRHQLMRPLLPRTTRIVACCAAALTLAGCGAGQVTQTDSQVAVIDGSSADIGSIAVRDVLIPYPEDHHGNYPSGSKVPVRLTLVNQGSSADTLVSASTPAARRVLVQGTTTIPAGTSVGTVDELEHATSPAPTTAPTTEPVSPLDIGTLRFVLIDTTRTVRPGQNIEITLVFRDAGRLTLPVPMGPPPEHSERKPLEEGGHHS
ncbi:MAG: copper chaperone PCu(A)C [Pseudonocardiaceae bacterium]